LAVCQPNGRGPTENDDYPELDKNNTPGVLRRGGYSTVRKLRPASVIQGHPLKVGDGLSREGHPAGQVAYGEAKNACDSRLSSSRPQEVPRAGNTLFIHFETINPMEKVKELKSQGTTTEVSS